MGHVVSGKTLRPKIEHLCLDLGFSVCRITSAELAPHIGDHLSRYLERGFHGSMAWMKETQSRRRSPRAMWPDARSAIVLGMNYGPDRDPLETLAMKSKATVSVYARHRDYHDLIKGKLKQIAGKIAKWTESDVKVFVDTAPLMEKPLAAQAGIGWQGKHTNLVSKTHGSWLFLGVILTSCALEPDGGHRDHCGTCTACLDICPTDAFPAPYQLDARRCISYLTIEHSGTIARELRSKMGNRIYGCDDCLAVCPWNKFAHATRQLKLKARDDLIDPDIATLLTLDDAAFRRFFSGSPIKRIGRNRFIRNVLIAAGNSDDVSLLDPVLAHLQDEDPVIRATAVWAVAGLAPRTRFLELKQAHCANERHHEVLEEWQVAGQHVS